MSDTFENMNPIAHKEISGFYGRQKTMRKIAYLAWNLVTLVKTLSCGSIEDLPTAQQLMLWHLHRNVVKVPVRTDILVQIYIVQYIGTNIRQDKGSHQKLEQGSKQRQPTIGMICTAASP